MSKKFSQFPFPSELQIVLQELSFVQATVIQEKAIPALLAGKDVLAKSATGSGKTFAFLLPLLTCFDPIKKGAQGIVLCPTRELATQVAKEAKRLGRKWPTFSVATLVGGQPMGSQLDFLRQGSQLIVGTPGRVLDHLKKGSLSLDEVGYFVLDEADRMLEMGFIEDVADILSQCPDAQKVFFSATYPEELSVITEMQNDPVQIEGQGASDVAILHEGLEVDEETKPEALVQILRSLQPDQALVFCHRKETVKNLADYLLDENISAEGIHGDLEQRDRDLLMIKFRNKSNRILVATDLAARGIDITGLDLVVNYDFPKPDIYVHRAGRSGRAGKSGHVISFFNKGETFKVRELDQELQTRALESVKPLSLEAEMVTICIFAGRKDKMRPGDILGALTGERLGLSSNDIGKIEIQDRSSYVAVKREKAEIALDGILKGKVKGRKVRAIFV